MRDLRARMLAALLRGYGLEAVAEMAAEEAGGPVAILLPARGLAATSGTGPAVAELESFVAARLDGSEHPAPAGIRDEAEIVAGDEAVGYVLAFEPSSNGLPEVAVDASEVLRAAALAALTEVAVTDARDELAGEVRATLLEDLRAGRIAGDEVLRRAARLGCELGDGAVALVTEVRSACPRHVEALITSEHPGAIAQALVQAPGPPGEPEAEQGAQRVIALLPVRDPSNLEATVASARSIAGRLRPHGPAAFSSLCTEAGEIHRSVSEAELMLEVISRDERMAEQLTDGFENGVYRLLFRAMASDPEEVRRFYEDTVAPLVAHDRQYQTDLLSTLESYLANDCNMNATARAVYAHRHTVAHRLARVRELTHLDPARGSERERLGIGIKAYRIIAPTLRA